MLIVILLLLLLLIWAPFGKPEIRIGVLVLTLVLIVLLAFGLDPIHYAVHR